jgi:hypothetical protein
LNNSIEVSDTNNFNKVFEKSSFLRYGFLFQFYELIIL